MGYYILEIVLVLRMFVLTSLWESSKYFLFMNDLSIDQVEGKGFYAGYFFHKIKKFYFKIENEWDEWEKKQGSIW